MTTTNEIRDTFLSYFAERDHTVVSSSPLVPENDPTLMFTNAGMVQFKNVFTGQEQRDYTRATTSQKVVRAGGKHNDLENVGYTARHHTFFEMLGNFSFGDYFKADASEFAWKLLTQTYGLPADKLIVTVYSEDEEAASIWKKVAGLSDDRIIRIPTSDNFWTMGETGPCGPCSEIFFDHGPKVAGGPPGSPDEDGDRFIEIWNLVFMQYEQVTKEERVNLPKPSIDTGMGLERIAAVLQGKHDNYDIDLMRALITAAADESNVDPDGAFNKSLRVIADHLRSTSFLIADGVLPSNEGRGYVLRRIMRRAMRHIHLIGQQDPMMYKLVPALVNQMGGHFAELRTAEPLITETLKLEETAFKRTLDRGLKLLETATGKLGNSQPLDGEVAFKLYDTYGFPLDLTQDILRGDNREVDMAGFTAAMDAQKAKARAAWKGSGGTATDAVWFSLRESVGTTEFLGYSTSKAEGVVTSLVLNGAKTQTASAGATVALTVNQTPFYAESGGQQGDQGVLKTEDGAELKVTDTTKQLGALFVHHCEVLSGSVSVGDAVTMEVDSNRRSGLRQHHSATHLLHEALRRRLGDHVTQKGSLVAADRLRFDFSQPKALSAEDIAAVEIEVNSRIAQNTPVTTRLMAIDDARAEGAMALFGEKYGDEVRVVSMGGDDPEKSAYSIELCGGTHVSATGDIGLFRLSSEEGLASGVRRIEAQTGLAALAAMNQERALLAQLSGSLKAPMTELPERVAALADERKRLEREVSELNRKVASGGGDAGSAGEKIGEITFIGKVATGLPARELKPTVDDMKKTLGSGVIALVSDADGKASIVIGVTEDLTDTVSAVDLVRAASAAVGGKGGGGRPDMAQAGGPDGSKAADAIAAVKALLAQA